MGTNRATTTVLLKAPESVLLKYSDSLTFYSLGFGKWVVSNKLFSKRRYNEYQK
jgi:hypothetical protein